MKLKIFVVFLTVSLAVFMLAPKPVRAIQSDLEKFIQKVEILKREISVLKMLLSNFLLQKEISSPSFIALNLSDGSVALEKDSNRKYPIASITKLMTAAVAIENIPVEQKIVINEEMLKPYGSSPAIYKGLEIGVEDLIKASLIQSSNDASEALSQSFGKEEFLDLMNKKAKELGMPNTDFHDVYGLNSLNQSTTQDMAKLLSYIYQKHPQILSISRSNDFWLPDSSGKLLKFQNVNNFYYLASFIGGKAGYSPEARQTLAAVFEVKRQPHALIILNSSNRQADAFSIIKKLEN